HRAPELDRILGRAVDLHSDLPGVSSARKDQLLPTGNRCIRREVVVLERVERRGEHQSFEDPGGGWSLQRDQRRTIRRVVDLYVMLLRLLTNPCDVLLDVRGVDDQHVSVRGKTINQ